MNVEKVIRTCLDGIFLNLQMDEGSYSRVPYGFSTEKKNGWLESTYNEYVDDPDAMDHIRELQEKARVKCSSVKCYPFQQQT